MSENITCFLMKKLNRRRALSAFCEEGYIPERECNSGVNLWRVVCYRVHTSAAHHLRPWSQRKGTDVARGKIR